MEGGVYCRAAFIRGQAFIRWRRLMEGGVYWRPANNGGWRLLQSGVYQRVGVY